MPAAMVMKWAKEKGMSQKEAERRWENAKLMAAKAGRNPEITKKQEDWKYVVGIFKSMMGKKKTEESVMGEKKTENLIELVRSGVDPSALVDSVLDELHEATSDIELIRAVAETGTPQTIEGTRFDKTLARIVVNTYDSLKPVAQKKFAAMGAASMAAVVSAYVKQRM